MEQIIAVVEGHLEARFIEMVLPKTRVVRGIPNGDHVPVPQIARVISDHLDVIGSDNNKVIILMDREKRKTTISKIYQDLLCHLNSKHKNCTFYVGISDRESENWILADPIFVRTKYNCPNYNYCGDGKSGKAALKKLVGVDLPPTQKAMLLKSVSVKSAQTQSPSLLHFINQINFFWGWAAS